MAVWQDWMIKTTTFVDASRKVLFAVFAGPNGLLSYVIRNEVIKNCSQIGLSQESPISSITQAGRVVVRNVLERIFLVAGPC